MRQQGWAGSGRVGQGPVELGRGEAEEREQGLDRHAGQMGQVVGGEAGQCAPQHQRVVPGERVDHSREVDRSSGHGARAPCRPAGRIGRAYRAGRGRNIPGPVAVGLSRGLTAAGTRRIAIATATWNGTVVAESDDTVIVEGNHYFPRDALKVETRDSPRTSVCPWKGTARYLDLVVDGQANEAAAWYYPEPKAAAAEIRDRVAFWKGVAVTS